MRANANADAPTQTPTARHPAAPAVPHPLTRSGAAPAGSVAHAAPRTFVTQSTTHTRDAAGASRPWRRRRCVRARPRATRRRPTEPPTRALPSCAASTASRRSPLRPRRKRERVCRCRPRRQHVHRALGSERERSRTKHENPSARAHRTTGPRRVRSRRGWSRQLTIRETAVLASVIASPHASRGARALYGSVAAAAALRHRAAPRRAFLHCVQVIRSGAADRLRHRRMREPASIVRRNVSARAGRAREHERSNDRNDGTSRHRQ